MSIDRRVFHGVKRTGTILMDRLVGYDGLPISIASISSITYVVTDLDTRQRISSGTLIVATTIFDGLQKEQTWTDAGGDSLGYNFKTTLPASVFSGAGDRVQIDIRITPVTGERFFLEPYILDLIDVHL